MGIEKFSAALDLLKGFEVNLFVGEDIFKGKLIGVEADHVVLETENNYIFYYSIDKIQAITKNTKKFQPEKTKAQFLKTQSLKDLLLSFQHTWVTILSINKQRFTGVLSEIDEDFATLINGEERILIKLVHISNILKGFIKEEVKKSDSSKDNGKNDSKGSSNGSSEKDDSKKEEKSKSESKEDSKKGGKSKSESKDDSKKEEKSKSESKDDSKKEEKSKSESKDDSKSSDKKQKSDKNEKEQDQVVMEEANNTMVWSQPIKIESTMVQVKDEGSSNLFKSKKSHSEEKNSSKSSTDMKKSKEEMSTKDNKTEETWSSKPKGNDQQKEMKSVKETATIQQTDNIPAPPYKIQMSEGKSAKKQEATTTVTTANQATKKTENTKAAEAVSTNNSQNSWKQKEQEQKVFRFAGEPVTSDSQRTFPFAGWPNRNNRTTRF